jgi:hypothetical protein
MRAVRRFTTERGAATKAGSVRRAARQRGERLLCGRGAVHTHVRRRVGSRHRRALADRESGRRESAVTVAESSFAKAKLVVERKGLSDSLIILLICDCGGNRERRKNTHLCPISFVPGSQLGTLRRHMLGFASRDGPFDFAQGGLRRSLHNLLQNATEILPLSVYFHSVDCGS